MSVQSVLTFNKVSFAYEQNYVIHNVSFEINKGDFTMIVGANGVGKSTILRILFREVEPQYGEISLFGIPLNKFSDWERVGYVPQHIANPAFPATVREIVEMSTYSFAGPFKKTPKQAQLLVDEAIDRVGLSEHADARFGTLSGGQLRRTMLARAFVSKPELLFLDEPDAGLDIQSEKILYETLQELNKNGSTIVIITHDTHEVAPLANRVLKVQDSHIFEGEI